METTSANNQVHHRSRQAARCAGSEVQPPTLRTPTPVTNGFLRHSFMPMYQPATELADASTVGRDFFKSCSHLSKHYGLSLNNYSTLPYPYNMLMAERAINHSLKSKRRHRQLLIVAQEDNRTCLVVKETFNHDFGLYYIPVMPIYDLW